jgi:uncharacterized membrane protein YfcA
VAPDGGIVALVAGLGLAVGIVSGLLGIGGGVVMAPLLLLSPPALGLPGLDLAVVTGVTAVQSFAAAVLSALGHAGHRCSDRRLLIVLGVPMWIAGLFGGWLGGWLSGRIVLAALAAMTSVAALLMLRAAPGGGEADAGEAAEWTGSSPVAAAAGGTIGLFAGIIGQGGGFLYLPTMVTVLGVPMRIAIATATLVGTPSAALILVGRIVDADMPWLLAGATLPGLAIGSQLGARLSYRVAARSLRRLLGVVIGLAAVELWHRLIDML